MVELGEGVLLLNDACSFAVEAVDTQRLDGHLPAAGRVPAEKRRPKSASAEDAQRFVTLERKGRE